MQVVHVVSVDVRLAVLLSLSLSGRGGGAGMPCTFGPGSVISYLFLSYLSWVALYSSLLSSCVYKVFYILILYFSFIIVTNLFYHFALMVTQFTLL